MADIEKVENLIQELQQKLINYFKDQPNWQTFIAAIGTQFQEVYDNIWKLKSNRWLSTARQQNLDNLGEIIGEKRNPTIVSYAGLFTFAGSTVGLGFGEGVFGDPYMGSTVSLNRDDVTYLLAIKGKIVKNFGSGTPEEIIAIARFMTGTSRVELIEELPAGVSLKIKQLSVGFIDNEIREYTARIIQGALPIGVVLNNLTVIP